MNNIDSKGKMTGSTQLMLTSLAAGVATGGITALMGGSLEESLMNGVFGSLACYGMGLAWGATTFTFGASAAAEITTAAATGYTKSNLQLGQQIHNVYKIADVIPRFKVKEFRDVPGVRPDFVDFITHTIYELKPNNPRAVADGLKQLARYKEAFERYYPGSTWSTKLDTY